MQNYCFQISLWQEAMCYVHSAFTLTVLPFFIFMSFLQHGLGMHRKTNVYFEVHIIL